VRLSKINENEYMFLDAIVGLALLENYRYSKKETKNTADVCIIQINSVELYCIDEIHFIT